MGGCELAGANAGLGGSLQMTLLLLLRFVLRQKSIEVGFQLGMSLLQLVVTPFPNRIGLPSVAACDSNHESRYTDRENDQVEDDE